MRINSNILSTRKVISLRFIKHRNRELFESFISLEYIKSSQHFNLQNLPPLFLSGALKCEIQTPSSSNKQTQSIHCKWMHRSNFSQSGHSVLIPVLIPVDRHNKLCKNARVRQLHNFLPPELWEEHLWRGESS